MSKKMLVNATHHEENRVAIVEEGILTELDIEVAGHEPTKGNIYKAVVVRVESGLQAAFVDYGAERLGFLQIDEINYKTVKPDYQPAEDGRRPKITDLLQRGQELLVQITKEERGTKGAALTTYLSLAGRYMVIMPGSQTRGVSRKAESDSQRKELKKAMSSLDLAEGVGYIVRTAALDQTREELERDYRYLIRLFENIKSLEEKAKAPALIYKESNLMIRSIRDYFTTDMDEVLIDDPQVFKEAKDFFQMVMPDQAKLVKLHQERRPIFSRYQIEDQIESLNKNKVPLPSGGSIVIDPTEALVAIDVNSGKMASEQGVEATATKTNLEAAAEVGRQLRLRDLGGLIVIDFIDMRERKHMRQVENQVKKSLENDKARVNVGRISQFGLLEMSRQRIKAALTEGSYLPCPHCQGAGRLKSPETQAVSLLRKIHASAAKGQVSRVDAQLPLEVAAYLLNHKREELVEMERDHKLSIHIHGNRDFLADQVEIEITKKEKEKSVRQEFVSAGSLPMPDAEPEQSEDESTQLEATKAEAEPEAEGGKKRRRRRRRKPASATAEIVEGEEQQTTETKVAEPSTGETTAPLQAEATDEQTDQEAPAKKPQRRRRSSSRSKKPAVSPQAELAETATAEESPKAEQAPAATEGTEEKPKPSRRGRRKTETVGETSLTEAAQESQQDKAEATASTTATPAQEQGSNEKPQAESKPKPRRGRPRKPKTVEKASAAENSQDAQQNKTEATINTTAIPVQEQSNIDKPEAEDKPKPRRGRRPAKKPGQEALEPSSTTLAEQPAADTAETKAGVTEKPADKKPVRRSRKTKPSEATESKNSNSEAEAAQNSNVTEEKPKQRRASRSKAKPKAAEVPAENKDAVAEAKAEEKQVKKPATKRAPRKAAAKKPATAAIEAEGSKAAKTTKAASAEKTEDQKPNRRRTVKKKPADDAPSSSEQ